MARPKNFKQALIATMIPIFTHTNSALVGLAKNLLEDAGVGVVLKNEFSTAGFPPYNLQQELWLLDAKDLDTAKEVLTNLSDAQDRQDESES